MRPACARRSLHTSEAVSRRLCTVPCSALRTCVLQRSSPKHCTHGRNGSGEDGVGAGGWCGSGRMEGPIFRSLVLPIVFMLHDRCCESDKSACGTEARGQKQAVKAPPQLMFTNTHAACSAVMQVPSCQRRWHGDTSTHAVGMGTRARTAQAAAATRGHRHCGRRRTRAQAADLLLSPAAFTTHNTRTSNAPHNMSTSKYQKVQVSESSQRQTSGAASTTVASVMQLPSAGMRLARPWCSLPTSSYYITLHDIT